MELERGGIVTAECKRCKACITNMNTKLRDRYVNDADAL